MKTPTINIYINEKTKHKLNDYCAKHHVSYSTFTECLVMATTEIQKQLVNDYLCKGDKTSLKVNSKWDIELEQVEKAKLYTNLIYLYFNKKLSSYYTNDRYQRIMQIFQKEIDKKTDQYWNYNNFIRNEARMLKNKNTRDYLAKKLASYDRSAT